MSVDRHMHGSRRAYSRFFCRQERTERPFGLLFHSRLRRNEHDAYPAGSECLRLARHSSFTGVTFPFVSRGGSSLLSCWMLIAYVKAADTRREASFAVRNIDRIERLEDDDDDFYDDGEEEDY